MIGSFSKKKVIPFNGTSGVVFTANKKCVVFFNGSAKGTAFNTVTCRRISGLRVLLRDGFDRVYGAYLEVGETISVSYPHFYELVIFEVE